MNYQGHVVYDSHTELLPLGPLPTSQSSDPAPDSLVFDSKFESGNLRKAVRTAEKVYTLVLEPDAGSQDFTQWYYFSVANKQPIEVTFRIVNFVKEQSLYTEGMQPLVRSRKRELSGGEAWLREGKAISYEKSEEVRKKTNEAGELMHFYVLTFSYSFQYWNDTVHFAYSHPYTYTDLLTHLRVLERLPQILTVTSLCKTSSGTSVPLLTITNDIQTYESMNPRFQGKKAVVMTARVHPGETISSIVMQGVIDFLVGESNEANALRSAFVFLLLPMLNPDGVTCGNYRCSTEGVDLNRTWTRPNKTSAIFHAKELIERLKITHEVLLFVDIHGHSRKKSSFLYGCDPTSYGPIDRRRAQATKLFPFLLQSLEPCFSFSSCSYSVSKCKESTARVVSRRELGIVLSYTLENSFFSSQKSLNEQMTKSDYIRIGANLCISLLPFIREKTFLRAFLHSISALNRLKRVQDETCLSAVFKNLGEIQGLDQSPDSGRGKNWSFESVLNLNRDSWEGLIRQYELTSTDTETSFLSEKDGKPPFRKMSKVQQTRLEQVLESIPRPQKPYFQHPPKSIIPRTPKIPIRMTTYELDSSHSPKREKVRHSPLREQRQKRDIALRSSPQLDDSGLNSESITSIARPDFGLPEIRVFGCPQTDLQLSGRFFISADNAPADPRSRSTRPDGKNYWDQLLDKERSDPFSLICRMQDKMVGSLPVRDYKALLPGLATGRVIEKPQVLARLVADSTRMKVRKEIALRTKLQ